MSRSFRSLALGVLAALSRGSPAGAGRRENILQGRLEHLCGLDALGLTPSKGGILKKWADKYGIKIELTQINDYWSRSTSTPPANTMPV